jgi:hypothetical protein
LERVESWTWHSMPMTASYLERSCGRWWWLGGGGSERRVREEVEGRRSREKVEEEA